MAPQQHLTMHRAQQVAPGGNPAEKALKKTQEETKKPQRDAKAGGAHPQTATEKILRHCALEDGPAGSDYFWAEPDLILGHEATVALAIDRLEAANLGIKYPERCLFAADHFVPPATAERAAILHKYLDFLKRNRLSQRHLFNGISHQLMLEDPRLRPGLFVAGADSHTTTAGALGAVAAGFGSTDMLIAFAQGKLAVKIPPSIRLDITGHLQKGVGSRDLALWMMGKFGQGGLAYRALEVSHHAEGGNLAQNFALRATLANQAVDAGAKNCIVLPDAITHAYLQGRDGEVEAFPDHAFPDAGAPYLAHHHLDLGTLRPIIARPPDPSDVVDIAEVQGKKVHQVFIGSCSGGRLHEFQEAAAILAHHRVAPGLRLVMTPASRDVYLQALSSGVLEILVRAGALVTDSSCGACGGIDKGLLGPKEVCVSTSNRNFRGRMGSNHAEIYLASASTAAATAVRGVITDPREFLA